jgi:hypothetical protein
MIALAGAQRFKTLSKVQKAFQLPSGHDHEPDRPDGIKKVLITEQLRQNSMAPPFIACTVMGMSPCPVMKMIGSPVGRGEVALNSRPLRPGNLTSSTSR